MFSGLSKAFTLGNLQSAYNGISKGFKMGYDVISSPFRSFGHLVSGIDHYLNMANNLPFLSNISRLIQGNPLYAELLATNTDVQSILDVIERGGSDADDLIRKILKMDDDGDGDGVPERKMIELKKGISNVVQGGPTRMIEQKSQGNFEIPQGAKTAIS